MRYKLVPFIFLLFMTFNLFGQDDSMYLNQTHYKVKGLADNLVRDLDKQGVKKVMIFFVFGTSVKKLGGTLIYQKGNDFCSKRLTYEKGEIEKKKIPSSKINKQAFLNALKKMDIIDILKNKEATYISEDHIMFLSVVNMDIKQSTFFKYSNYLVNKDVPSIQIIRELIKLSY